MNKKTEISDVSKTVKTEKEKKDALANIDINNIAGKKKKFHFRSFQFHYINLYSEHFCHVD